MRYLYNLLMSHSTSEEISEAEQRSTCNLQIGYAKQGLNMTDVCQFISGLFASVLLVSICVEV